MNISWGSKPGDAVGMHVAAWVLGESLMHLATVWSPAEVCVPDFASLDPRSEAWL